MNVKVLTGIRSLAADHDVFVVDLWGTLHDGVSAYPGAIDALKRLIGQGKRVGLLSNVPRRKKDAEIILANVGITPELYTTLITSGEAVYLALRDRPDVWHRRLTGPCWHLGPKRERGLFEGLDFALLDGPDGAGFCVATGAQMNEEQVEDYQDALDRGLALGLPMICANPDIVVPVGDALVICAGAFAAYYARNGGDVFWHGKPHAAIYRTLFEELEALGGGPVDPARAIAIGDALTTDIAGAANAGIASALLVGGVHRPDLRLNWRGKPDKKALAALIEGADAKPDSVLRRFAW
jgi:HAD superfamily hydrolase (TIGR01459 family)